ncbi:MAG TPA: flagellin FliC [Polyangiaceae bacterium]|nr:flagellin FliC [Polyangiaceae bacterium]
MPLYINTNVASLQAQKNLNGSTMGLQKSFERLSSGYRINSAADDAAGLAISESLKAQTRSFAVAERNANNGISMVNTAEGGLGEMSDMLIRMRELAVQASNGDLTTNDRANIDVEYQELVSEIDRVSNTTEFNGTELLSGASANIDFQVGIGTTADDKITVSFGGIDTTTLGVAGTGVTGADATNAQAAITALDSALDTVSSRRASFGAANNRLQVAVSSNQTIRTNLEAANSRIRDVDVAEETSKMARSQVLQQAGTSVLAQANQAPQLALSLLR